MTRIDTFIGDLEDVLAKLGNVLGGLKQMKEDSEAVEKAREKLPGRRRKKDRGDE